MAKAPRFICICLPQFTRSISSSRRPKLQTKFAIGATGSASRVAPQAMHSDIPKRPASGPPGVLHFKQTSSVGFLSP